MQLNQLKSGIKNGNEVTLKILLNVVGDYNDKIVNNLLLTKTQVSKLLKVFANHSLSNIKLWKIQLHQAGQ